MSHHNPRHPHRHHVRVPEPPNPPGSVFWAVLMFCLVAVGFVALVWLTV